MFSTWQLIIILVILAIMYILSPSEKEGSYNDYDCYDKSPYKCGNCRKHCKWHYVVEQFEKMEKEKEKS